MIAIVEAAITPQLAAAFAQRYGPDVVVKQGLLARPESLCAAHCGTPDANAGQVQHHAGGAYGYVHTEQQAGRVDAELHSVGQWLDPYTPWLANEPGSTPPTRTGPERWSRSAPTRASRSATRSARSAS